MSTASPTRRSSELLTTGEAGGQEAHDEAAARDEPAGGDGRAQHHRGQPGPGPDDKPPEQEKLPQAGHGEGAEHADPDETQSDKRNATHPEMIDEHRRKRSDQPEQREAHREGGRDIRSEEHTSELQSLMR